ncbi:MAG: hypothetical protein ACRDMX_03335 [Solirubrobacteraceae bacterium]
MFRRIYTGAATLAVLGVIALGGSALASTRSQLGQRSTHAVNASAVQSDPAEAPATETDGPGGPNVQQGPNVQSGNQSAPDSGTETADAPSSESSGEAAGGEVDGPGGYQDPPGSAGVQQQGQH